jgi:tryptophan-rich sensory protein
MCERQHIQSEFFDRSWKIARDLIRDEDTLINHRMSWLMTSNFFLFSAFFVIFNRPDNAYVGDPQLVETYMLFIPVIGVVICLTLWLLVMSATKQVERINNWWNGLFDSCLEFRTEKGNYPCLVGESKYTFGDWRNIYSILPFIFAIVWLLLFFVSLASLAMDEAQRPVFYYGVAGSAFCGFSLYLFSLRMKKTGYIFSHLRCFLLRRLLGWLLR